MAVGSDWPIRVQSMTTPATQDVLATAAQIERLVDVGCEIVRVTVPTTKDADAVCTAWTRTAVNSRGVTLRAAEWTRRPQSTTVE